MALSSSSFSKPVCARIGLARLFCAMTICRSFISLDEGVMCSFVYRFVAVRPTSVPRSSLRRSETTPFPFVASAATPVRRPPPIGSRFTVASLRVPPRAAPTPANYTPSRTLRSRAQLLPASGPLRLWDLPRIRSFPRAVIAICRVWPLWPLASPLGGFRGASSSSLSDWRAPFPPFLSPRST